MLEAGWSGGGGGDCPQMANLMMLSSLRTNSLVMTDCTHRIRAIQQIIKRVTKMRMKTVEALATNMLKELSGDWNDQINKTSLIYNPAGSPMTFPHAPSLPRSSSY
jgi:hypothetical protein